MNTKCYFHQCTKNMRNWKPNVEEPWNITVYCCPCSMKILMLCEESDLKVWVPGNSVIAETWKHRKKQYTADTASCTARYEKRLFFILQKKGGLTACSVKWTLKSNNSEEQYSQLCFLTRWFKYLKCSLSCQMQIHIPLSTLSILCI